MPKKIFIFVLFIITVLSSFFMRTFVYRREAARIASCYNELSQPKTGAFVPFTIESAMMFAYSSAVADGRGVPKYDRLLIGMKDVKVSGQDTVGLEYFLGYGYRLKNKIFPHPKLKAEEQTFEDDPYFTNWARFQIRLWASLVAGFIFLWLVAMRCPWTLALAGAFLHVISPAAIARYTGQDLVRGEFCLPIVTAVFLTAFWYLIRPSKLKLVFLGVMTFLSFATWDMCQICFGVWSVSEIFRLICGGIMNKKRLLMWVVISLSAILAALLIPYHQVHRLIFSPLILFLLPLILATHLACGRLPYKKRIIFICLAGVILFSLWFAAGKFSAFSDNYGHFGNLLKAKLAFNNVKPRNPLLLNFDARILWSPAMHSANTKTLRMFFPLAIYTVPLLLIPMFFFTKKRKRFFRFSGYLFFPLFMTLIYFTTFIYLVRYHVFAVLFLCILTPLLFHLWFRNLKSLFAKLALSAILAVVLISELRMTLILGRDYEGEYFQEIAALIKWFRAEKVENDVFLADFTLSPVLKAYCGAGIILQPKFELGRTRKKVEEYYGEIFHGTESSFNAFCVKNRARYYVFDCGYADDMHIYSPRYCAAAINLEKDSPVFKMYFPAERKKLRTFYEIIPPKGMEFIRRKYVVFKTISPEDRQNAAKWTDDAYKFLDRGNLEFAARLAKAAVFADPLNPGARIIYAELFGKTPEIRLRGF